MRIVELRSGGGPPAAPVVLDDGFVALLGDGARVVDVRGEPAVALELPGVVAAAATRRGLVALDAAGVVARWERGDDRWRCAARVALPPALEAPELTASPSGRSAFVDGAHGRLVDLDGGRIVSELEAGYGTARPCFDVLPDGREALFVAAPGYMSVRMLDAAGGEVLGRFDEQTSTDFCHVDFRLALDGARLVTFGCVWAWPYEVRIYDATPWTRAGAAAGPAAPGFPLPLVRAVEPLASNTLLAAHVDAATGDLTSACLEQRAALTQDAGDALAHLRAEEPALAAQLDAAIGDAPLVLIARRLDPRDGRTVSAAVHAVPAIDERRVHYAPGHRVVLAGPRLLVCDASADRLDDLGELRLAPEACTAVTADGATLIVVSR
ncbi:MAG: hypothetical protein IPH80_38230 [Myxococcales bacterium]|nr:hypothetical protein [Myxococcales bacterium]